VVLPLSQMAVRKPLLVLATGKMDHHFEREAFA
jgi:hypothetical protein